MSSPRTEADLKRNLLNICNVQIVQMYKNRIDV